MGKIQDNELGGNLLVVSADGDASHGSDDPILQSRKEIRIRFVQKIWLRYHALPAVDILMGWDPVVVVSPSSLM